jgi:hypothetical protein
MVNALASVFTSSAVGSAMSSHHVPPLDPVSNRLWRECPCGTRSSMAAASTVEPLFVKRVHRRDSPAKGFAGTLLGAAGRLMSFVSTQLMLESCGVGPSTGRAPASDSGLCSGLAIVDPLRLNMRFAAGLAAHKEMSDV